MSAGGQTRSESVNQTEPKCDHPPALHAIPPTMFSSPYKRWTSRSTFRSAVETIMSPERSVGGRNQRNGMRNGERGHDRNQRAEAPKRITRQNRNSRWSVPLRMWKNPNDEPQAAWCTVDQAATSPDRPGTRKHGPHHSGQKTKNGDDTQGQTARLEWMESWSGRSGWCTRTERPALPGSNRRSFIRQLWARMCASASS